LNIYVFSNKGLLQFQGLDFDLAAGLEESLICKVADFNNQNGLGALWNIDHNLYRAAYLENIPKAIVAEQQEENLDYEPVPEVIDSFQPLVVNVHLTEYYMTVMFINSGIAGAQIVDGTERVLVELNGEQRTLDGTVYPNGRIYLGARYRQWLQANHHAGENLQIEILGPNHIRLT